MTRLPMAGAICAVALSGMLLPVAARSGPGAGCREPTACRHADRRHHRAGKSRRARMGMAGEGDDESRHAAAALQPRQGTAVQDKQVTSYTISSFNPELYCEVGKHFDYIWFEMQHSTMSFDEVRRMMLTCPASAPRR